MLIDVKFEKGSGWSVDENVANLIPEIRAVLNKDNQGKDAVAVIALCCDPLSKVTTAFEGNFEQIKKEAFRWVYKDKAHYEDFYSVDSIKKAIDTYLSLCDTPISRMIKQHKEGIIEAGKRVQAIANSTDKTNTEELLKALKEMPNLTKQYLDADISQLNEVNAIKSKVRGDRQLTPAENRVLAKQQKRK